MARWGEIKVGFSKKANARAWRAWSAGCHTTKERFGRELNKIALVPFVAVAGKHLANEWKKNFFVSGLDEKIEIVGNTAAEEQQFAKAGCFIFRNVERGEGNELRAMAHCEDAQILYRERSEEWDEPLRGLERGSRDFAPERRPLRGEILKCFGRINEFNLKRVR